MSTDDWSSFEHSSLSISRNSRFDGVPCSMRNLHVLTRPLSDADVAAEFEGAKAAAVAPAPAAADATTVEA